MRPTSALLVIHSLQALCSYGLEFLKPALHPGAQQCGGNLTAPSERVGASPVLHWVPQAL